MKNVLHDVDLAVTKTWEVAYGGHLIRLENSMKAERLFIDDKLVDEVIHQSLLSHVKPFSKLSSTIEGPDGTKERVSVKIGGFIKLTVHIKVSNKTILKEKMTVDVMPWEHKESILTFIEAQVTEHGTIINTRLPDTEYEYDESIALVPGYADQINHDSPLPLFEKGLVKQIKKLVEKPTMKQRRIIYEKVNDELLANYGGKLLYYLQEETIDAVSLEEEAIWFLENAAHREVVKLALLLLSFTDLEKHKERLVAVAQHEEFTMFALLALSHLENGAYNESWKLAKQLKGWGKVVAMHYIEAVTEEEKRWFLEQRFNDLEMDRAVALKIAETAELDVLLSEKIIDRDIFFHINSVVYSLMYKNEVNEKEIDQYLFAPFVLKQFISKAKEYEDDMDIASTINAIRDYINEAADEWAFRYENGWEVHEHEILYEALNNQ